MFKTKSIQKFNNDKINYTDYNCGICKRNVKLEKSAPVMCSECGSRILYKKSINKVCEYVCR